MAQRHLDPTAGPVPADALAGYLRAQATEFLRALRLHRETGAGAAGPEGSVEAARALRRAARRISASLHTFQPVLDPDWSEALRPELAWVSGTLAQEHAYASRLDQLLLALHRLSGAASFPPQAATGPGTTARTKLPATGPMNPAPPRAAGTAPRTSGTAPADTAPGTTDPTGAHADTLPSPTAAARATGTSAVLPTGADATGLAHGADSGPTTAPRPAAATTSATVAPHAGTSDGSPVRTAPVPDEALGTTDTRPGDDTVPGTHGDGTPGPTGPAPDAGTARHPAAGPSAPNGASGTVPRTPARTAAARGRPARTVAAADGTTGAARRVTTAAAPAGARTVLAAEGTRAARTVPAPERGNLTVGAAKAGALLDRQLTLARTRAHSTALQALGSSRFHGIADKVALLASEVPLSPAAAGADLRPLADAARDRLADAVTALPLLTAGSPYNAEALIHGLSPDPAPHPQDAPWHQVRLLLRLHRYAREVLHTGAGAAPPADPRLLSAGEALDRHRDASEAAAAAAQAARTPRIAPATAYALGVLHADQRHEVEAARYAFQRAWQKEAIGTS